MIRVLDLIFSLSALFVLLPLFLVVGILLLFNYENKIFYLQKRVGKHNKKIRIIKFATMLENSPNIGTGTITLKNDPRVFPIGRILRKFKINELPQLINVIKGEMSLVGPRPLTKNGFDMYPKQTQKKLSNLKPGLSGIGSLFFRNEEVLLQNEKDINYVYNEIIMPYKGNLEIWFCENQSLINYFKVIFLTVIEIIKPNMFNIFSIFPDLPLPQIKLKNLINKTIHKKN